MKMIYGRDWLGGEIWRKSDFSEKIRLAKTRLANVKATIPNFPCPARVCLFSDTKLASYIFFFIYCWTNSLQMLSGSLPLILEPIGHLNGGELRPLGQLQLLRLIWRVLFSKGLLQNGTGTL